jgi:hypothetical protein
MLHIIRIPYLDSLGSKQKWLRRPSQDRGCFLVRMKNRTHLLAALTLAQRARCAAAIFRLAEADIVRFLGVATIFADLPPFPFTLADRAF